MRSKLLLLGLCGLLGLAFAVSAWADPINSETGREWTYPFITLADVNEDENVNNSCLGQPINCGDVLHGSIPVGGSSGDKDYFYFTVATPGTVIQFGTAADGASPVVDTYIYLYNSSCVQLAYNDDYGGTGYSYISYTATAAGVYCGMVRSYSSSYTGTYKAFVNCVVPEPPPPNDRCEGAIVIPCGPIDLSGTTQWAANDYNLASGNTCTGYTSAGMDMVYKFTVLAGANIDVTYTSTADGSFYIVTDCADLTTCVIGADDTFTNQPEVISHTFTADGTYYLILDNWSGFGNWTLVGTLTCPTAAGNSTWGKVKNLYR